MELKAIYGFALLLVVVGMILGIGVMTLDKFGVGTYNAALKVNDSLTLRTDVWTALSNPTADLTSRAYTATNVTGSSVDVVCNSNLKWDCRAIKIADNTNIAMNNTVINVTYYYGVASVTSAALTNTRTEISTISTTWLGLIVTVVILAIILTLVIQSFGGIKGRE